MGVEVCLPFLYLYPTLLGRPLQPRRAPRSALAEPQQALPPRALFPPGAGRLPRLRAALRLSLQALVVPLLAPTLAAASVPLAAPESAPSVAGAAEVSVPWAVAGAGVSAPLVGAEELAVSPGLCRNLVLNFLLFRFFVYCVLYQTNCCIFKM